MDRVLMHTCCAPCSLSCIDPLRSEGIEPVAFWYNPNIHPWKEYQARRDCLLAYAPSIGMEVRVQEDYGLKEFVRHVAGDIDHRCAYCYSHRLEGTARYAAEHGFSAFTSTLLASTYQDHKGIAAAAEHWATVYGVKAGDSVTYVSASGTVHEVPVAAVCEYYTGTVAYMNGAFFSSSHSSRR